MAISLQRKNQVIYIVCYIIYKHIYILYIIKEEALELAHGQYGLKAQGL